MKADRVLTMDEYPNEICVVPKHVRPPAADARHIPIRADDDVHPDTDADGCRCDRWGHPCPGCLEGKLQEGTTPPNFSSVKQVR